VVNCAATQGVAAFAIFTFFEGTSRSIPTIASWRTSTEVLLFSGRVKQLYVQASLAASLQPSSSPAITVQHPWRALAPGCDGVPDL